MRVSATADATGTASHFNTNRSPTAITSGKFHRSERVKTAETKPAEIKEKAAATATAKAVVFAPLFLPYTARIRPTNQTERLIPFKGPHCPILPLGSLLCKSPFQNRNGGYSVST